jgi:eukaryotic-like serine/threonine-protein kinase
MRVLDRIEPSLRFIHAGGWLHGDVKPSNIFIDVEGGLWLGDFGSSVKHGDIRARFGGGTPA